MSVSFLIRFFFCNQTAFAKVEKTEIVVFQFLYLPEQLMTVPIQNSAFFHKQQKPIEMV